MTTILDASPGHAGLPSENGSPNAVLRLRDPTMDFSHRLKAARERAGLTQPQAAKAWNVPVKSLRNWEQSLRTPHAHALLRLLPILAGDGDNLSVGSRRPSRRNRPSRAAK